ncbi:MAG: lamin tail domain-containing protein [Sandaracinaceae bacterium]|nr:lamin tail domain-containing protein [Sandaracinaceae bacterium]
MSCARPSTAGPRGASRSSSSARASRCPAAPTSTASAACASGRTSRTGAWAGTRASTGAPTRAATQGGEDGGPSDAGRDAGRDAGTDAGRDAGRDAGSDAGTPGPPSLLFSEYVEGSSSNKALEIANLGASPVDLSRCSVRRFANGTSSPTPIALSGTLAAGDVFVVCHGSLEGAATLCDATTATLSHNGNDAYDLFCDGATLDTFGQIGVDPGTAWTGGGLSTFDYVLRRRCTVTAGDANGSDAFPTRPSSGRAAPGSTPRPA